MPKTSVRRRHVAGPSDKKYSMAELRAQVAQTASCPILVHRDLTCGCDPAKVILLPEPIRQPAPQPEQLAGMVERVDVTSPDWPTVRDALARALEGELTPEIRRD